MKKFICLILCLSCVLVTTACGESPEENNIEVFSDVKNVTESPEEDFSYEMDNGEITITGYKGTDLVIFIPSVIKDRPVTIIGEDAFKGYDMTHVAIPDSVVLIEENAFAYCECLTSVEFSKNLEEISRGAFWGAKALTEAILPDSLNKIESCGFYRCKSLKTVSLPKSLKYLGEDAFCLCDCLESLKIPDSTYIEIRVFSSGSDDVRTEKFLSPFGSASGKYSGEKKEIEKVPLKLIVREGSYAHKQLIEYSDYFAIEVE